MKRTELIGRLLKEGFSEKTLVNFTDKQLNDLSERIVTTTQAMASNPEIQKLANDPNKTVEVKETLKGNQKKIDKNHNGKIDSDDFAILNKEKKRVWISLYLAPLSEFRLKRDGKLDSDEIKWRGREKILEKALSRLKSEYGFN